MAAAFVGGAALGVAFGEGLAVLHVTVKDVVSKAHEFIGWIPDKKEKSKVETTPGSPNKSNTPTIGMKFDCDDSAYEFYKDYAHRIGFSHNHEFAPSPMKHMLRSKRKISLAQKAIANDAKRSRISIQQTIELWSMQAGGRENLGFMDVDYKNHVHNERRMALRKEDGPVMMEFFHKMQLADPSYFYSIQVDDDGQIMNIFLADARSIIDYGNFGDVICFDTTYRTNRYERPFAPFVGVNHHKQSIIFGAALLYDETIESFKWLFETFLTAMLGKQPKTILTDQSATMAKAITEVFPKSNHRLCVWHIYQNAAKNLHHVFHSSKQFAKDFTDCLDEYEDEDEWLVSWDYMLKEYGLTDNKWLRSIFDVKEKWAIVYGRHMFTANMKSTQHSESRNNVLKKYLNQNMILCAFQNITPEFWLIRDIKNYRQSSK
ncbi:protein FAR1-RELATED SEQUENCE 5-like [Quercus suber]|uniref:protein FAR1-RELATED SEQUENCE 5-like n=1 Tax=Quercus suber TaxID=58331 RepID=UPI0032DFDD6E